MWIEISIHNTLINRYPKKLLNVDPPSTVPLYGKSRSRTTEQVKPPKRRNQRGLDDNKNLHVFGFFDVQGYTIEIRNSQQAIHNVNF